MNTRKNKRKSKHRPRRRRINRTKKLKGGGWVKNLSQLLRCVTTPATQCMLLLDKAENIPRSLEDLMDCVNKGSQLLDYCKSIPTSNIPTELSRSFNGCISELSDMITFVKDNNILLDFTTLLQPTSKSSESSNDLLFQKYSRIYTAVSSVQLSDVYSRANVIIFADWWRSKLEYMITVLTTVLTQIIGRFVRLIPDPALAPAPAPAAPAAPSAASSMMTTTTTTNKRLE
jgi:hypothetical protein